MEDVESSAYASIDVVCDKIRGKLRRLKEKALVRGRWPGHEGTAAGGSPKNMLDEVGAGGGVGGVGWGWAGRALGPTLRAPSWSAHYAARTPLYLLQPRPTPPPPPPPHPLPHPPLQSMYASSDESEGEDGGVAYGAGPARVVLREKVFPLTRMSAEEAAEQAGRGWGGMGKLGGGGVGAGGSVRGRARAGGRGRARAGEGGRGRARAGECGRGAL